MKSRYLLRLSSLLFLALLYLLLTQKYRAYDIDNPWFLSFSYNACHTGVQTDEFERFRFPSGMDGVHLFGKLASGIQCLVMNQVGWTPAAVVGVNVIFGVVSLWLLWSALLRLGYREQWIAAFILLIGVSEPVVSMMEKARYEFFAFLLLCLAMRLAVQGWELVAAFTALIAVETEPAAIMVPLVVFILLASRTKNKQQLAVKAGIAGAAAIVAYVTLHPGAIHEMLGAHGVETFPLGGTLRAYFFERKRHLIELLVILIGAFLYWKHRQEIPDRTPVWLGLATSFALCLLHPTPAYAVFAIPFILWPTLEAYDKSNRLKLIPLGLFAIFLLEYTYLYRINLHEGFNQKDFALVRQQINDTATKLHLPTDKFQIVGDYSLWFAHPLRYRAISSPNSLEGADLYLCFDGPLEANGLSALTSMWCPEAQKLEPMREITSLTVERHLLHIFAPANKNQ